MSPGRRLPTGCPGLVKAGTYPSTCFRLARREARHEASSPSGGIVHVLVAARGAAVADLLRATLGAADGVDALSANRLGAALRRHRPDLLVLDESSLGSVVAITACRDVRREDDTLPILYLSGKSGSADEVMALDSGADSYLVVPCVPDLLLARIRALARRVAPNHVETLRFEDIRLDTGRRAVHRGDRALHLTTTEYALLTHFLRNPDRVLDRDYLIERVWGRDYAGSLGVLDVYVCYLRSKLEAEGEPRLIQTVRGAGYVMRRQEAGASREMVASRLPRRRPSRA
jgi:two-component system, OmpR family, response regulator MprA